MRWGNIIYQVSTELDLKLSFGGSLIKCAGFKGKKQQKAIQQNKQWISSRLNFLNFYFTRFYSFPLELEMWITPSWPMMRVMCLCKYVAIYQNCNIFMYINVLCLYNILQNLTSLIQFQEISGRLSKLRTQVCLYTTLGVISLTSCLETLSEHFGIKV